MNATTLRRITTIAATLALGALGALPACTSGTPDDLDSEELVGVDENTGTTEAGVTGSLAVGTTLKSTANVNLRTGPSTDYSILHVVPTGATVTVVESDPKNGFYKVKHDGSTGWSSGKYYTAVADGGGLSAARQGALDKGKMVKGFSYWWGHGRFRPEGPTSSTKGTCSGSCPGCSHSGSYGADCSGFVAKAWSVPSSNSDVTVDSHPYGTVHFVSDTSQWSTVSRANMKPADAMVYNSGGAGHIFLYASGDPWGSLYSYECKGCSAGCVYGIRTASSSYHGIRRAGW